MKLTGIMDFIEFLDWLDKNKVYYSLSKLRDDAVMATIHIVGARIEVEFFKDHIEYSVFSGDESVHDGVPELIAMIKKFID